MGTRSTIALEFADGSVEQVYCHWDGYLSHNGKILLENYSDPFKLQRLIDLGYLSSLGAEIGERIDFDAATSGKQCKFYGRDRGEELSKDCFANFEEYLSEGDFQGFDYILRTDGKWYVNCDDTGFVFVELATALPKKGVL